MPGSFQAVYNASKSFVQSFGEALQEELKETSVTLTLLMPGPTETEFFERAEMTDTAVGRADKEDPADVARQGSTRSWPAPAGLPVAGGRRACRTS
jgi:short-subunit dehydrogenase